MKPKLPILLPVILSISVAVWGNSPADDFQFMHLDNTRGLSNNQIECILRDSRGFLWIGTNSGLNRYDGYTFRIYRNGERGIPYNKIVWIGEDASGNIWIKGAANTSHCMYDWRTDTFHADTDSLMTSLGLPPAPYMIRFDGSGNMYACYEGRGIYRRRSDGETVHCPQGGSPESLSTGGITSLAFDRQRVWVIGSSGILECLDTESGRVVARDTFLGDNPGSTITKSLFLDTDGQVWVYPAANDQGAALFDPRSGSWRSFGVDTTPALSSGFVRTVGQDARGTIWIGTDHGGINLFDKATGTMTVVTHDPSNPWSLCQNSVISIYCDPTGGTVWAGTYKNGVSLYHPGLFKFHSGGAFSPAEMVDCNGFCKDRDGNLWIGTNGEGLVCYNERTGTRRTFRHDPADPRSLSSDIITTIREDSAGVIWIGTFMGGMCSWDGRGFTRWQFDESDPNTLSSRSVYGICEDPSGDLWIGTLGGGVDRLDRSRRRFSRHTMANTPGLPSDYVVSVSDLFDGNIYLCTSAGLAVIDTATGEFSSEPAVAASGSAADGRMPNYAIRDSRGTVWVSTDSDITAYGPGGAVRRLITADGLPMSEVISLVEDTSGDIWAGTRAGLVRISREDTEEGEEFRTTCYRTEDGLPGQVFNHNAVYRDPTGRLYFGTTRGFTGFDPSHIVAGGEVPRPRFTSLSVNGHRIDPEPAARRAILRRAIDDTREVTLRHDQTEVAFGFSDMSFINPERSLYRYRLEGLDKEWKTTVGSGVASYSHLDPGSYTLRVEVGTGDGVWADHPLVMQIDVKSPPWFTWWAILIYMVVAASLIRLFVGYKLDRQREHYIEAQRMLEIDKKHEVDELKFRFFTNVSHEFKTPVTLILTPLEQLLRLEKEPGKRSLMEIMRRNAQNLLGMVNEILDLRKLEMDKMMLRPATGEIIGFIKEICRSFSTLADERSIRLVFTTWIDELHMDFDADKMTKILTNLLTNAFKYTVEGSVEVSVSITESIGTDRGRMLRVRVADTGIGIAAEHIDKIFDRFYRAEESTGSGTGLGLHMVNEFTRMHGGNVSVESLPGQGSVFTVAIPIQNSSFRARRGSEVLSLQADSSGGDHVLPGGSPGGNGKPLLLVVDDNDDFRDFVAVLFEESYKVITAADGREACDKVLEDLPDLIIADVMMPGMDGYEFCRTVKGDIRTSHIPVVLLTARSSEESKYSGIEAGADDYIAKPFDIDMLRLRISKIIERQKKLYEGFRKRIDISPGEVAVTSMDEKFVRRAVSIVEEHIDRANFLVDDLCGELGISRVYFYKKILALTDKTPSEFIRFIRIKRAADLLEKSRMFVNEVAYKVGFNDPKYFRNYFKKEFGVTPSEYKKQFEERS